MDIEKGDDHDVDGGAALDEVAFVVVEPAAEVDPDHQGNCCGGDTGGSGVPRDHLPSDRRV
ncbi:hypothetical protein FHP29_14135 [Nocardioides albidus]|uniref:Uncharacterized protein n=1 Tax=Nocardioides albidus TaxID=1517589 RepID=A0A5C4VSX4_9ACTN|nr:hypothetical protein [Nocardioides albidus]TNM38399.1 hypothetical protein FHP29_14135 [Nocardioides albidus]